MYSIFIEFYQNTLEYTGNALSFPSVAPQKYQTTFFPHYIVYFHCYSTLLFVSYVVTNILFCAANKRRKKKETPM